MLPSGSEQVDLLLAAKFCKQLISLVVNRDEKPTVLLAALDNAKMGKMFNTFLIHGSQKVVIWDYMSSVISIDNNRVKPQTAVSYIGLHIDI